MVEIFDDIKRIYRFISPREELASYVEFFSETSPEDSFRYFPIGSFEVKMFPSWTPTIWINLKSPYTLAIDHRQYSIARQKDVVVLRNTVVSRKVHASDQIFTIKFFPGALDAIFGISQIHLIDKVIPATDIIPAALIEKIKTPVDSHEKVKVVEDFLMLNLSKQKRRDHYIQIMQDSIEQYVSSSMHYNTAEIASRVFTTSRSVNRYFHNVIGTSPKKYLSILRARAALISYVRDCDAFDPTGYGYYDMSHFYKGAIKFTGQRMGST